MQTSTFRGRALAVSCATYRRKFERKKRRKYL
jgi:hypothetical protein